MTNAVEESFIRGFVIPEAQERYLEGLSSANRRQRTIDKMARRLPFEWVAGCAEALPPHRQSANDITTILRQKGAPDTCYLISENSDLDGKTLPLAEALNKVVGVGYAAILCCVPGKLAYFESDATSPRYILLRSEAGAE